MMFVTNQDSNRSERFYKRESLGICRKYSYFINLFLYCFKKIYGKIICTTFTKQHAKGAMNVAKHSDVVFTVFHPKGLNDDTEFSGFYNAVFKGV